MCIVLTNEDKSSMIQLEPDIDVRVISNGIDHQKEIYHLNMNMNSTESIARPHFPSLLFVGNFAYEPSIDAAMYFSQIIFPLILEVLPNTKLFLVGNAPPSEICSLTQNKQIEVTGFVKSLLPFYKTADVVVCPLRRGGGIKIKVLEALSAGKAIVSTSVGAQGLDLTVHPAVIVTDEPDTFAENVLRLLLNSQERYYQEQTAFAYAKTLPTWEQVAGTFLASYTKLQSEC